MLGQRFYYMLGQRFYYMLGKRLYNMLGQRFFGWAKCRWFCIAQPTLAQRKLQLMAQRWPNFHLLSGCSYFEVTNPYGKNHDFPPSIGILVYETSFRFSPRYLQRNWSFQKRTYFIRQILPENPSGIYTSGNLHCKITIISTVFTGKFFKNFEFKKMI